MQPLSAKLLHRTYITPEILSLDFQADMPLHTFIAGQFLTFMFTVQGQEHYRPYSLATLDATQRLFTLTLKIFSGGVASNYWQKMPIGASIPCFGPHGDFIFKKDSTAQRVILAATGTGIVPFHAMQQDLVSQLEYNPTLCIYLIHGVKKAADLLYRSVFDKNIAAPAHSSLLKDHPRFYYLFALSQEEPYIHLQHHLKQLQPMTQQDDVYLCGNSAMINAVIQLLRDSQATIFIEKFF